MPTYKEFHRRSLADRDAFWRARRAHRLADAVHRGARLLEAAVREMVRRRAHEPLPQRGRPPPRDARAARRRSSTSRPRPARRETLHLRASSHAEVNRFAAMLQGEGVGRGDRVLIYMPMIAEAAFAMLACARIGAIHSVVFGGFAAASLATRIDDAKPKVMVTSDAGMRGGKAGPLQAARRRGDPPRHASAARTCSSSTAASTRRCRVVAGPRRRLRDAARAASGRAACRASGSNRPRRRTSSTRRARPASRRACSATPAATRSRSRRRCGTSSASQPGETMFTTSDIGWVVGHSYIVYGPLINGSTTIMYEGLPIRPDPAIWWKIVAENKVRTMFSSPTAIRVLKKQDPAFMKQHDLSSLQVPVPRRRAARRADRALGVRIARRCRSSTTTGRPRPAGRSCRRSPASRTRRASSAARRSRSTATTCGCCTKAPARKPAPTRRAC